MRDIPGSLTPATIVSEFSTPGRISPMSAPFCRISLLQDRDRQNLRLFPSSPILRRNINPRKLHSGLRISCAFSRYMSGGHAMTTSAPTLSEAPAVLHVFEQDGGWHWGITVPRSTGSGFKLIAFSQHVFPAEDAAQRDGARELAAIAASSEN